MSKYQVFVCSGGSGFTNIDGDTVDELVCLDADEAAQILYDAMDSTLNDWNGEEDFVPSLQIKIQQWSMEALNEAGFEREEVEAKAKAVA